MLQRQQRRNQRIDRTNPETSGGKQNRSAIRREPVFRAHLLLVFDTPEDGVDRYAADRDLLRRYTERFEINARFLDRDEVLLVMMDQQYFVGIDESHANHHPTRTPRM